MNAGVPYGPVVTYAKVEWLDAFGAVIGSGRVTFTNRAARESIRDTVGMPGTELAIPVPATDRSDPRCPYRLRITLE